MGFDLYENTALLDFRNTRYKGAEVRVRADVSIEEYRAFLDASDGEGEWEWFRTHVLVDWNVERKGEPVDPADREKIPGPLIRAIIRGWMRAYVEIDLPLGDPSNSGESSAEAPREKASD